MRDVFYYGKKPNVHPKEKFATSIEDARRQCTTEHFWIINEFCDYHGFDWDFDFEFLPDEDVWAEDHNNVWPSQHQKDSGTWLCSSEPSPLIIYRNDVNPVIRKNIKNNNWVLLELIDENKFDFSWHPDPTDPPYIYKWGCKFFPVEFKTCLEYTVDGATEIKYMKEIVELLPEWDKWEILHPIDKSTFDFTWRPDPREPNLIHVFGNDYYDSTKMPTVIYKMEGAVDEKHMPSNTKLLSQPNRFQHLEDSHGIDYSWVPDPTSPPYIYVWGNQWNKPEDKISIQYVVDGATEFHYMEERAVRKSCKDNWEIPSDVDTTGFDFSWEPSPADQPYIYQFGTQWQKTGGPRYLTPGVHKNSDVKYIDLQKVRALPNKDNFVILDNNIIEEFDYSWHSDETEEPYIYVFGNNLYPSEVMSTIQYIPKNADRLASGKAIGQVKYVNDIVAKLGENRNNWVIHQPIEESKFDFSWVPNPKDPPYIYSWGNKYISNKYKPTVEYKVQGATEIKYMDDNVVVVPEFDRWYIPNNIDDSGFDYTWRPDPLEPILNWQFGTQWQKTGGPRYTMPGAIEVKYINSQQVKALPNKDNWKVPKNIDTSSIDFSWHPDDTSPPYIYRFPTQWAMSGGPIYTVPNATEVKYIDIFKSKAVPCIDNWDFDSTILDESSFDFSWHPYAEDEPFIYQFGTQWQKTGGPRYLTPGIHKNSPVKYIDTRIIKAKRLPNKDKFIIIDDNVIDSFDYSWHPDETEEPFVYIFGNTQYSAEIMPTIKYVVEGASQIKYINDILAVLGENKTNWIVPNNIDVTGFDFSWVPHPDDAPYIYQFGTQWQKTGGPKYVVEGASEVKYVDVLKSRMLPNRDNWEIPDHIDSASFDFSWHPDATEEPYVYKFGTQWQKTGGPRYLTPGIHKNSSVKYIDPEVLSSKRLPNKDNFVTLDDIVVADFDYSWHPDETEELYVYVFGNNYYPAEIMPTIEYIPKGVILSTSGKPIEQVKYVNDVFATLGKNKTNWVIHQPVDETKFDFSWVPNPKDPPYMYIWGNKYIDGKLKSTIEYHVANATDIKYMEEHIDVLPEWERWIIPEDIDKNSFDFTWRPDPREPDFIWQFGTQHQKTGGPQYITPGIPKLASGAAIGQVKYIDGIKSRKLQNKNHWTNPSKADTSKFDFSWHPDDTSPPYIYQFGTLLDREDGPRYMTPKTNGVIVYLERIEKEEIVKEVVDAFPKYLVTTSLEDLIKKHPTEMFWALNLHVDYTNFDFNWKPNIEQSQFVQVFGSSENSKTQTYLVNAVQWLKGFTEFNWVEEQKKNQVDMFFVDKSNLESQARFDKLKLKFPNIQKTRYLNSWVDTINRCINRASSNLCWILTSELDYTNFDFDYYPNPWQMKMVHVFGTQWSHWGTTFMVNRESFAEDTKWIKIIEHLNNLNFVKDRTAIATDNIYDIYVVDHGNKETETVVQQLTNKASGKSVNIIPYSENYLLTFKKLLKQLTEKKEHYIWLCSSICDYSDFDFSYICDPFSREQLHVFPSDKQKLGDTFLVNVNKFRELIDNMSLLNEYNKINYNQHQRVKRLDPPTIITTYDSHVLSVMEDFDFPYAVFLSEDNKHLQVTEEEPMSLWGSDTKDIIITSTGGTRIVVPKEVKNYVDTQLYDYPYIKKASRLVPSNTLDIIFLSNGEPNADENYENLLKLTRGLPNKVTRIDGVNGRVAAYHKTADASTTSWYFVVWGKLFVNPKFDWSWQPDRLQIPKNYIFHAKNPLNGLVYGHQAVVAYNKKLALSTKGKQLDFTMESPHQVIPILSGTANYNCDVWTTWRTAFRECIKLRYDNTEENKNRLKTWLTTANGEFADYSIKGANNAIEYFDSVDGEYSKLKLSYEWDWLREKFQKFD